MRLIAIAICAVLISGTVHAAEIRIATFNTESDSDTQPEKVAQTIRDVNGVDIWAMQEVESGEALRVYAEAAKISGHGKWRYVLSESGRYSDPDRKPDYLGILYRTDLFRHLETAEYHAIRSSPDGSRYGRVNPGLRSALFLRLLHRASGTEFYVGTVHLKCCANGVEKRAHQVGLIVEWIKRADVPVILLGDTNIPIEPGQHAADVTSPAFVKLTNDGGLIWIEPSNPHKTQCSPSFNSMLDQIYRTANLPATDISAEIQFTGPEYCEGDAEGFADHRPVVGQFKFE